MREASALAAEEATPDKQRRLIKPLLAPCRALLDAERIDPDKIGATGVRLEASDFALRACDLCGAEIFNRCVRILRPLVRPSTPSLPDALPDAPDDAHRPPAPDTAPVPLPTTPNPLRERQRQLGEDGDFCLRACRPAYPPAFYGSCAACAMRRRDCCATPPLQVA